MIISLLLAPITARGTVHVIPAVIASMAALGALGSGLAYV